MVIEEWVWHPNGLKGAYLYKKENKYLGLILLLIFLALARNFGGFSARFIKQNSKNLVETTPEKLDQHKKINERKGPLIINAVLGKLWQSSGIS